MPSCILIELRTGLLLLYQKEVFRQKCETNTHQSNSKAHILVCSLGYIPGKCLMFFPGEMHEALECESCLSHPTSEIAVVHGVRTCSVTT